MLLAGTATLQQRMHSYTHLGRERQGEGGGRDDQVRTRHMNTRACVCACVCVCTCYLESPVSQLVGQGADAAQGPASGVRLQPIQHTPTCDKPQRQQQRQKLIMEAQNGKSSSPPSPSMCHEMHWTFSLHYMHTHHCSQCSDGSRHTVRESVWGIPGMRWLRESWCCSRNLSLSSFSSAPPVS